MDTLTLRPALAEFAAELTNNAALAERRLTLLQRADHVADLLTVAALPRLTPTDFQALLDQTSGWPALKNPARHWAALVGPNDSRWSVVHQALALIVQAGQPAFTPADLTRIYQAAPGLGFPLLTELLSLRWPDLYFHWLPTLDAWLKSLGLDPRTDLPADQRTDPAALYFAMGRHLEDLRATLSETLNQPATYLDLEIALGWLMQHATPATLPDWREWLLEDRFASLPRERLAARLTGEQRARELLQSRLGQFTPADLRQFLRDLNSDWHDERGAAANRFFPALSGHAANQLIAAIDAFNHWSRQFFTASDAALLGLLASFWAKNDLPGAGTSLPTALLYLRDPRAYNIWLPFLSDGLRIAANFQPGPWRTVAGYQRYNAALRDFRDQHHLEPQELDAVLQRIVRRFATPAAPPPPPPAESEIVEGQRIREATPTYSLPTTADAPSLALLHTLTGYPAEFFENLVALLHDKRQLLFYGPPGVGKTYLARHFASYWLHTAPDPGGLLQVVQLHPSFSYEDFIEGLRPTPTPTGLTYPVVPGLFRRFAEHAERHPQRRFVLLLDELNRADLARVFGELLYLLEYRDSALVLPTSGEPFRVPPNLYLFATINTADRSLTPLDHALRRRFHHVALAPSPDVLRYYIAQHPPNLPDLPDLLALVNRQLEQDGRDWHQHLGHSHLMHPQMDEAHLARVWQHTVLPLLDDLFFDQPDRLPAYHLATLKAALHPS